MYKSLVLLGMGILVNLGRGFVDDALRYIQHLLNSDALCMMSDNITRCSMLHRERLCVEPEPTSKSGEARMHDV